LENGIANFNTSIEKDPYNIKFLNENRNQSKKNKKNFFSLFFLLRVYEQEFFFY
jgi:hypothetical protein